MFFSFNSPSGETETLPYKCLLFFTSTHPLLKCFNLCCNFVKNLLSGGGGSKALKSGLSMFCKAEKARRALAKSTSISNDATLAPLSLTKIINLLRVGETREAGRGKGNWGKKGRGNFSHFIPIWVSPEGQTDQLWIFLELGATEHFWTNGLWKWDYYNAVHLFQKRKFISLTCYFKLIKPLRSDIFFRKPHLSVYR